MPANGNQKANPWRLGRWLFLLGTSFYLLTTSGERPNGDGALMYSIAENLVDKGSLCANRYRAANTYQRPDGCVVLDYGLGTSLVHVPGVLLLRGVEALGLRHGPTYEAVRALLTYLVHALIGGLIWWFYFVLAFRLSGSRRRAFWLTVLVGTTTTVWFFQRAVMSDGLQAFGMLGCVLGLHAYRNHGGSWKQLVGAGLAFGFAVMCKGVLWILAPALLVYLAWDDWRNCLRPFLVFGALLSFFVLFQLWFNYFRFEDILDFGYHTDRNSYFGFSHPLWLSVWAYLFSPSKSFFLYNPLAFFALWGWKRFYRRHQAETLLFAAMTALVVYGVGRWWCWHADWTWGPRFLLVLVPFLTLPGLYLFPDGLRQRKLLRGTVVTAALLAFWVQILGCFVPVWRYLAAAFDSTLASFPHYDTQLGGKSYRPMDDQLTVHYLPHFSPILGHWWLFKHLLTGQTDFNSDHPWKSLNIEAWEPKIDRVDYTLEWWGAKRGAGAAVVLLALLLGAATVFCSWRAYRDLGSGADHGGADV